MISQMTRKNNEKLIVVDVDNTYNLPTIML